MTTTKKKGSDKRLEKALDREDLPVPEYGDGGNLELWDEEFSNEVARKVQEAPEQSS